MPDPTVDALRLIDALTTTVEHIQDTQRKMLEAQRQMSVLFDELRREVDTMKAELAELKVKPIRAETQVHKPT